MNSEQEKINNALNNLKNEEKKVAEIYSSLANQITEPKLQSVMKNMEQLARKHYAAITEALGNQNDTN
jgi:rubrerythrin